MSDVMHQARLDAITGLVEQLMTLLACTDLRAAQGFEVAAKEARRSLMRAITAMTVIRDELTTIEIVERLVACRTRHRSRRKMLQQPRAPDSSPTNNMPDT